MSRKYKFRNNDKIYFTTFTITNWIDLFIRDEYRNILLDSLRFCQREKDLEVYAWCIMTNHAHPHWRGYAVEPGSMAYPCHCITPQPYLPESHPQELATEKMLHQKLDYLHNNPVVAGYVRSGEDWLYSSAIDYNGGKGMLDLIMIEPRHVTE